MKPKSNFRIHWSSRDGQHGKLIKFSGVPYVVVGRKSLQCHLGKDFGLATKKKYAAQREETQAEDHSVIKRRLLKRRSKKMGCPAEIYILHIISYPEFKLKSDTEKRKRNTAKRIRAALQRDAEKIEGIHTYVASFPKNSDHKFHENAGWLESYALKRRRYTSKKIQEAIKREVEEIKRIHNYVANLPEHYDHKFHEATERADYKDVHSENDQSESILSVDMLQKVMREFQENTQTSYINQQKSQDFGSEDVDCATNASVPELLTPNTQKMEDTDPSQPCETQCVPIATGAGRGDVTSDATGDPRPEVRPGAWDTHGGCTGGSQATYKAGHAENDQSESFLSVDMLQKAIWEFQENTQTKYIVRQKSKAFGNEAIKPKLKSRIHWSSRDGQHGKLIKFSGVPYVLVGRKSLQCHLGTDFGLAKKKKYAAQREMQAEAHSFIKRRIRKRRSKKIGCPAEMYILHIINFPEFKIKFNTEKRRRNAAKKIREALQRDAEKIEGIHTYVASFPKMSDHKFHETAERVPLSQVCPQDEDSTTCEEEQDCPS
ncbi:uncharacterized protein LOC134933489 isoform X2 [Pseudophryne corroboree]